MRWDVREWIGWCATNTLWRESMACTLTEKGQPAGVEGAQVIKSNFSSSLRCLVEVNLELCLDDDHHDDVGGGWADSLHIIKKTLSITDTRACSIDEIKMKKKKVNSRVRVSMAQGKDDEAEKSGSSWSYINSNVLVFAWDFFSSPPLLRCSSRCCCIFFLRMLVNIQISWKCAFSLASAELIARAPSRSSSNIPELQRKIDGIIKKKSVHHQNVKKTACDSSENLCLICPKY